MHMTWGVTIINLGQIYEQTEYIIVIIDSKYLNIVKNNSDTSRNMHP